MDQSIEKKQPTTVSATTKSEWIPPPDLGEKLDQLSPEQLSALYDAVFDQSSKVMEQWHAAVRVNSVENMKLQQNRLSELQEILKAISGRLFANTRKILDEIKIAIAKEAIKMGGTPDSVQDAELSELVATLLAEKAKPVNSS
jgi:hypothetical protein